jgi:hypothetical protein
MPNIVLSGHKFSFKVERKSVLSLRLRLTSRNSFVVSCHRLTPIFLINKFISDHTNWINTNSKKIAQKKSLLQLKQIQILDENYEIIIKKMPRDSVVIFEKEQKIYANITQSTESHLKKIFDQKFRPLSLKLITEELKMLKNLHGFEFHNVTVKNTTSRFGSCSSTNNLNFNWQIIFLPKNIFRHILLHELTHTIHHDHSYKFWDQLSQYDPDWHAHRSYLKSHAQKHFLI